MKKILEFARSTADEPLKFVPLDLNTIRVVLICDASFGNAEELRSQLGFVILLADENHNVNFVHYGSQKARGSHGP
jgi:hypothetical protein